MEPIIILSIFTSQVWRTNCELVPQIEQHQNNLTQNQQRESSLNYNHSLHQHRQLENSLSYDHSLPGGNIKFGWFLLELSENYSTIKEHKQLFGAQLRWNLAQLTRSRYANVKFNGVTGTPNIIVNLTLSMGLSENIVDTFNEFILNNVTIISIADQDFRVVSFKYSADILISKFASLNEDLKETRILLHIIGGSILLFIVCFMTTVWVWRCICRCKRPRDDEKRNRGNRKFKRRGETQTETIPLEGLKRLVSSNDDSLQSGAGREDYLIQKYLLFEGESCHSFDTIPGSSYPHAPPTFPGSSYPHAPPTFPGPSYPHAPPTFPGPSYHHAPNAAMVGSAYNHAPVGHPQTRPRPLNVSQISYRSDSMDQPDSVNISQSFSTFLRKKAVTQPILTGQKRSSQCNPSASQLNAYSPQKNILLTQTSTQSNRWSTVSAEVPGENSQFNTLSAPIPKHSFKRPTEDKVFSLDFKRHSLKPSQKQIDKEMDSLLLTLEIDHYDV